MDLDFGGEVEGDVQIIILVKRQVWTFSFQPNFVSNNDSQNFTRNLIADIITGVGYHNKMDSRVVLSTATSKVNKFFCKIFLTVHMLNIYSL